uniref:Sugar phosphate transporter domain-containing protein n=1 Tax=Timema shepardi TaxID=629360 RepID=A0A7R9ALS9_TIMSH|nr:unnamed protein product [Timema shepardi]
MKKENTKYALLNLASWLAINEHASAFRWRPPPSLTPTLFPKYPNPATQWYCDSRSILESLSSFLGSSSHPLIIQILDESASLRARGYELGHQYIPSHVIMECVVKILYIMEKDQLVPVMVAHNIIDSVSKTSIIPKRHSVSDLGDDEVEQLYFDDRPRIMDNGDIPYVKEGLFNARAMFFLILWYLFSGCTLFLNKYILSYMKGDPTILGTFQMLMTTICGFIQMYYPCGMYKPTSRLVRPPGFYRHMMLVGCTRFTTVILGLVALNYVAVSFTETIKSSAPLFTVLISRYLLGEATGLYVNLSLIPVMGGLALCSANELSFDARGFVAAMATNLTDLQNVYSKMLISGDKFKYTPAELQFYTSIASVVVQIPASLFLVDLSNVHKTTDSTLFLAFVLNGIFFHFQSITAYVLMDYISPVTHSVANTAKRAFLIWLSVLMFGNPVTLLSGMGTCVVILGVLAYNKAQEYDRLKLSKIYVKKNEEFVFLVSIAQYLLHAEI